MSIIDSIAGKVRGMPVGYLAKVINDPGTPDAVKTAAFLEMNEQKRLTEASQQQQVPQGTVKDQTMQSMGLMALQNGRAQQGMQQMAQQMGKGAPPMPGAAPGPQMGVPAPAGGMRPPMGGAPARFARGGAVGRYAEGGAVAPVSLEQLIQRELTPYLSGKEPEIPREAPPDRSALIEAEKMKRDQMEAQYRAMQEYAQRRQGAFDTEQKSRSQRDFLTALVAGAESSRGQKGLGALAAILGGAGKAYAGSQNNAATQREQMLETMYEQQQAQLKQQSLITEYDRALAQGDYDRAQAIQDAIYKEKTSARQDRNKSLVSLYNPAVDAATKREELTTRASEGALDRASRERVANISAAASRAGGAGGGIALTRERVKAIQAEIASGKKLLGQPYGLTPPERAALQQEVNDKQNLIRDYLDIPTGVAPAVGQAGGKPAAGGKQPGWEILNVQR